MSEDAMERGAPAGGADTTQAIRTAAIEHHHKLSSWFDEAYKGLHASRFTNEFTYGRSKIDAELKALFAGLPQGGAVLDVGCGTGEQLLLTQSFGLKAFGLEPASGMREIAQRNVPGAEIKEGIATRLPYPDASFDAIVQIEVLRYLHREEMRQALTEARRVLRPSGRIFVTLVNRFALDGFYLRQRYRQWRKGRDFDDKNPHCDFIGPGEAAREFEAAGFADVQTHGRMFAPLRPLWRVAPKVAAGLAQTIEGFDDRLHGQSWARPFAGHLIVNARVPGGGANRS